MHDKLPSRAQQRQLAISYQDPAKLNPRATNPRTHSKKQIEQIAAAIRQFGFTNPILVDQDNGVVAGHGRLAAAKLLGLAEVPTVRLSDMSQAERRLLRIRLAAAPASNSPIAPAISTTTQHARQHGQDHQKNDVGLNTTVSFQGI